MTALAPALHDVRAEVAALVDEGLDGFDNRTVVLEVSRRLGIASPPGVLVTGQVKRALAELADAGVLIKARRGGPLAGAVSPRWYTPRAHRAAEQQCLAEAAERGRPLRDRAARVGVPLGDPFLTPGGDRLVVPMDVDAAERLVDLATAAADYSASR